MELRINKLISEALACSRRDADEYIKAGRVKINGKIANLSDLVKESDYVLFDLVDLPTKDLIRQALSDKKLDQHEDSIINKKKKKTKDEEIAESQRIQSSPKSAALRKTSKNNPENKLKRIKSRNWDDEEEDNSAFIRKNKGKNKSFESKGKKGMSASRGAKRKNYDDEEDY